MFGGYRKAKQEWRRTSTESPLTAKVHLATTKPRLPEENQLLELPSSRKPSASELGGETEDGTDDDSEVSFEEMLRREKSLETKLKHNS